MAKGLGSNPGRNFGLPSMRKSIKPKAKGIYPDKESGAGEYGSTQFPTIVESYNRESDYKRWKMPGITSALVAGATDRSMFWLAS